MTARVAPSPVSVFAVPLLLLAAVALTAAQCQAPAPSSVPPVWKPAPRLTWQWQLTGAIDTSVPAQVFDVDGLETPAPTVHELHAKGARVICYVDVGTVESYRDDARSFPSSVVGKTVAGWPDEQWLDIRRIDLIGPLMLARLDACRSKGFDGVEADNVDAFSNESGFSITSADEMAYIRWLAAVAHQRGLAVGLKNAVELVTQAVGLDDFAIVEDCVKEGTCGGFRPFLDAGKAVFDAEYSIEPTRFCPATSALGISAIQKRLELDAWRQTC